MLVNLKKKLILFKNKLKIFYYEWYRFYSLRYILNKYIKNWCWNLEFDIRFYLVLFFL